MAAQARDSIPMPMDVPTPPVSRAPLTRPIAQCDTQRGDSKAHEHGKGTRSHRERGQGDVAEDGVCCVDPNAKDDVHGRGVTLWLRAQARGVDPDVDVEGDEDDDGRGNDNGIDSVARQLAAAVPAARGQVYAQQSQQMQHHDGVEERELALKRLHDGRAQQRETLQAERGDGAPGEVFRVGPLAHEDLDQVAEELAGQAQCVYRYSDLIKKEQIGFMSVRCVRFGDWDGRFVLNLHQHH